MLAHLAYARRPKSFTTFVTSTLILTAVAALTQSPLAFGADTLPLGTLDARSMGTVSDADVGARGSMTSGLSIYAAESVVPEGAVAKTIGSDDASLLRDANRASVFFGSAVTNRLEVTLGLHGSFEHVKPYERDVLFPITGATSDLSWRKSVKQSGFAGASLFVKLKLLDWQGLRLAFAPFLESGAGEQATYSLTRSVSPKAGFMTIATYGTQGVADLSLNAGARYRDPEVLGDVTLRNEQFAKASIRAYASRDFAFFVAGEGRRLMTANTNEIDIETGKRRYEARESGDVKGGFQVQLGNASLSAFAGGMPKNAAGFGFGKTSYGMAVAMTLGNARGRSDSVGTAIEKDEQAKQDAKAVTDAAAATDAAMKKKAEDDAYPEMIGADIDPLEALGTDDAPDFKDVPTRQKQYELDGTVESEDAKVERELKALKSAEQKAAEDRATLEKSEQAQNRIERTKHMKEDDELMEEWTEEANKDVKSGPNIDSDSMDWNGLE